MTIGRLTKAVWLAASVFISAASSDAVRSQSQGEIDWSRLHRVGISKTHTQEIPGTGGRVTAVDPDDEASHALSRELHRRGIDVSVIDLAAFQRADREFNGRTPRSMGVPVDGGAVDVATIQDAVVLCTIRFGAPPRLMHGLLSRLHIDAVLAVDELAQEQYPSLLSKARSEVTTWATLNTCDGRRPWSAEAEARLDGPGGYRLLVPDAVPSIAALRAATTFRVADLMRVPPQHL